jgi:2-oxoglutarate ferredoxin oxidoreductase subunit gamma
LAPHPLETRYTHDLTARQGWVIAGAAGQKIGTAAAALCRGAILSGLWATQQNDYPVTVKTGHSVADVILSPRPVLHMGIPDPDVMIVLFPEGLNKERARIGQLSPDATLMMAAGLEPVETQAHVVTLDFSQTGQSKTYWAILAVADMLRRTGIYPLKALREALSLAGSYAEKNLVAVAAIDRLIVAG